MSMVRLDAPGAAGRASPDLAPGEKRTEPRAGSLFAALLAATMAPGVQGGPPTAQVPLTAAAGEQGAASPVQAGAAVAAAVAQRMAAGRVTQGAGSEAAPEAIGPTGNLQEGAAAAMPVPAALAGLLAAEDVGSAQPALEGLPGELAGEQGMPSVLKLDDAVAEAAGLPHPVGQAVQLEPEAGSGQVIEHLAVGDTAAAEPAEQAVNPPAPPVGGTTPGEGVVEGTPAVGESAHPEGAGEEALDPGGGEPGGDGLDRGTAGGQTAQVDLPPAGGTAAFQADAVSSAANVREPAPTTTPARPIYQVQEPVPVEQVMDLVVESLGESPEGDQTVTLKLHPEHLGEVRLHLHLAGREVQTLFEVTTPEARQALEQRGEELRQGLSQAGFTLSGFSVSTGDGRRQNWERRELEELLWQVRTERKAPPAGAATAPVRGPSRVQHNGLLDRMA